MPSKYIIKPYVENGFYHVFNRGVEKRKIYMDNADYLMFLHFMKMYLSKKDTLIEAIKNNVSIRENSKVEKINQIIRMPNFSDTIEMHAFVCMPNHFHLLLKQKHSVDMTVFMHALLTKYSRYFNLKYKRVGSLFQGRYKAVLINKEDYLLHLSRYIHLNPSEILRMSKLSDYQWSSYAAYIGNKNIWWVHKELILSYFKNRKGFGYSSYQGFVEGYNESILYNSDNYKNILLE